MQENPKQRMPDEAELMRAVSEQDGKHVGGFPCPSAAELKQFASGKYRTDEPILIAMLDHLADCANCGRELEKIRLEMEQKHSSRRRWYSSKLAYAFFCVAVLAATWFWETREPSSGVATVDLRHITRGDETSPAPTSITLHPNTASVRILLPVGSVDGAYEVGVFKQAGSAAPVVTGSAHTSVENGDLILRLPLSLKNTKRGSYSLGIRHGNSEWAYHSLMID